MANDTLIANFGAVRNYVHEATRGLTEAQLLCVPPHFKNNILWNVGHLIVDGCDMLYRPSGVDPPHPPEFTPLFEAGSSPSGWADMPDIANVLQLSRDLGERVIRDYSSGVFENFDPSIVSTGWPMKNLDQTLAYVSIHEAIHIGIIMSIRKHAIHAQP